MAETIETEIKKEYINDKRPAVQMAKRVSEAIGQGKKVVLGEIARDVGYAEGTSRNPQQITRSIAYRQAINDFLPIAEKARQNAIDAIAKRNMNKEKLPAVTDAMDKLTKNIQLLSGSSTENNAVQVSWSDTPSDTQ